MELENRAVIAQGKGRLWSGPKDHRDPTRIVVETVLPGGRTTVETSDEYCARAEAETTKS